MEPKLALGILVLCWALYGLGFVWQHLRVRRRRAAEGKTSRRLFLARASDCGLLLEAAGLGLVWTFRRPHPDGIPGGLLLAALALAAISIGFGWAALRRLGQQWRIRAVVTDDHELITSGPYALVRHPIYASLAGMLLATGTLLAEGWALALGLAIFLAGTEIRVRAEDRVLARRFPLTFAAYRRSVPAYLPFLR
ncbi:MAG: isoprenylcysteine carboxylmethyltransferase family protein [Acidobacteria bacterium]|nr:isoprenylcysteine carboxylmethyltransferase family protein [Acidobacteriota bacterium]